MKTAVLFDLGETLAAYYTRPEFPPILQEALDRVGAALVGRGLPVPAADEIAARAADENHEAPDFRVRPLDERLARIFAVPGTALDADAREVACRAFMVPIFRRGSLYPDALPALAALRARGLRLGLVSNTPWGCPAAFWREELARLGLDRVVDSAVFCTDAGWRKPAPPVFRLALEGLGAAPAECLFVGDNLVWDVEGARAAGLDAVRIDRHATGNRAAGGLAAGEPVALTTIVTLADLVDPEAAARFGLPG